ncbi:unnamed protein product [Rotaria sordida]|uniref:Uncharacterized protein n=1 Tax=Rotaria sordida TaxID=392033 RepID=A0A814HW95_9BILA|nr:unnamed protein product [Rotaria sordida]CAF1119853.1 unnamed protein product [Rotaria sordida]CAF1123817.1 unnamed protein product [Rotaria sordida]CAF1200586.1 unnamed protein product [Rotaria sordida]CAF4002068.1 unnamed protein product [Rotaria sordida]
MFHEMKNSLYKTRNISYPPALRTIDHVNIEGIWSKTLNRQQFILYNSKHPIVGTLESLKQLSKSDNDYLFFDETFKSCPNPFCQLYSVHSVNSELSTPKLYTLLPDKKNLFEKETCALAFMLPQEIGKLWVIIMDEYQDIEKIQARHLATGILPRRKKLFVNRNVRLHNLEERFKQQTLTLNEYLEKLCD